MQSYKILFVEDELSLALIVKDAMEAEGFEVVHADNADEGLKQFFQYEPDLVVLDVMLPKSSGFEVAKAIRNTNRATPILFLTAKAKVQDVVTGFRVGGNDYLKKPFSIEELIIRMQVLLSDARMLPQPEDQQERLFQLGFFTFDSVKQILEKDAQLTQLTGRESELLLLLCQHQNQLLSKQNILLKIWGDDTFFHSRSMDVFISKLRKHLKPDPAVKILNIRGAGYKLVVG